jgi:hypothetical protein
MNLSNQIYFREILALSIDSQVKIFDSHTDADILKCFVIDAEFGAEDRTFKLIILKE